VNRSAVLPGNRWDLLAGIQPDAPAAVTVVIPYFEAPRQLALVLAGLEAQTHPATRLQVLVVDDGSRQPPQVPAGVHVLRQADRGFRAAAARNLGAAAADGEVLCFLDGDTVPEPGYVAAASRLPALCSDAVVVGRRRHADLRGVTAAGLAAFLRAPTRELTEPAWLRSAYARSGDLLAADDRSYRYVISAVLTTGRAIFQEVGGFDATLVGYGGEDWELAHRLWCQGAVLAHERRAVAWHDGPDWAERSESDAATHLETKNAETVALAVRIPDPQLRGEGWWPPYAAVVAQLAVGDDAAAALLCVRDLLRRDVAVWLDRPLAGTAGDPRVSVGVVPTAAMARAWVLLALDRPVIVDLDGVRQRLTGDVGELLAPGLRAVRPRAVSRAARHGVPLRAVFRGVEDGAVTAPIGSPDLARRLPS
jgi:GT2 family glycosyltransferase